MVRTKCGAYFWISFFWLSVIIFPVGCKLPQTFNPLTASRLRSVELEHLGNSALVVNDGKSAEKHFLDALKLNRKDVELRCSYAESLWIQGKHDEAMSQLRHAVKYGGQNNAALRISLAEKLLVLDKIDECYTQSDIAIKLAPQDARSWLLRGKSRLKILEKNGSKLKPEDAKNLIVNSRNDYYRAASIDPENREILTELAKVQLATGQPEHSLATLQNIQEQFPPNAIPPEILKYKAQAYIALKQYDEANNCITAANNHETKRE